MNRAFPSETIRNCDNCGNDMTVLVAPEGGYEANDQRDYVDADPRQDESEWVFVCSGCRAAVGIDEADE